MMIIIAFNVAAKNVVGASRSLFPESRQDAPCCSRQDARTTAALQN
ncbi:MAG: hypothetical protein QNJ51_02575 [Calothrix sp. MO_167.B12]|nr:hypothetical protein [Calothrix sp. MO_167.B12]